MEHQKLTAFPDDFLWGSASAAYQVEGASLTVKYQDNLSAGRVQTPTLALVRNQEKKIESFRPQTYFTISLTVGNEQAKMVQKNQFALKSHEEAQAFVKTLSQSKGTVVNIEEKTKTEKAPLPYDLTEIQREANQRYGYSAKKTLGLVQSLYETHKIVTYPRTDSKYLTNDMKSTMKERLQAISDFAPEVKTYLKNGAVVRQTSVFQDSKVTDHHALLPTENRPRYEKLSNEEQKIYQMIVTRFLGLFAEPHKISQTKITVVFGNEQFVFRQNRVLEAGWKTSAESHVDSFDWKKDMRIQPDFTIKKELSAPPKPLTEASLLGLMEKHSLGTPATRVEIIEGKNGAYFRCKFDGTTEKMLEKKEQKKKMTKHEERRLMKKYSQAEEPEESPLAAALKAAMKDS